MMRAATATATMSVGVGRRCASAFAKATARQDDRAPQKEFGK